MMLDPMPKTMMDPIPLAHRALAAKNKMNPNIALQYDEEEPV
jgi:hypothetical protein